MKKNFTGIELERKMDKAQMAAVRKGHSLAGWKRVTGIKTPVYKATCRKCHLSIHLEKMLSKWEIDAHTGILANRCGEKVVLNPRSKRGNKHHLPRRKVIRNPYGPDDLPDAGWLTDDNEAIDVSEYGGHWPTAHRSFAEEIDSQWREDFERDYKDPPDIEDEDELAELKDEAWQEFTTDLYENGDDLPYQVAWEHGWVRFYCIDGELEVWHQKRDDDELMNEVFTGFDKATINGNEWVREDAYGDWMLITPKGEEIEIDGWKNIEGEVENYYEDEEVFNVDDSVVLTALKLGWVFVDKDQGEIHAYAKMKRAKLISVLNSHCSDWTMGGWAKVHFHDKSADDDSARGTVEHTRSGWKWEGERLLFENPRSRTRRR